MSKICLADRVKQYMNYIFDNLDGGVHYRPESSWPKDTIDANKGTIQIKQETKDYANEIYNRLRGEYYMSHKNPKTLAASIVYLACIMNKQNINQYTVARVVGIKKESTIRYTYSQLVRMFKLDNPNKSYRRYFG